MDSMDGLPKVSKATFIGIMIAITGNVLISLALNLQKLAHKRVEAKSQTKQKNAAMNGNPASHGDQSNGRARSTPADRQGRSGYEEPLPASTSGGSNQAVLIAPVETQPLIPFPVSSNQHPAYGTRGTRLSEIPSTPGNRRFIASRFAPETTAPKTSASEPNGIGAINVAALLPADVIVEGDATLDNEGRHDRKLGSIEEGNETEYLKSKLWWMGFLLMNIGETGNFISYAWAPASVVAPLGTFSLMANCLFAPLLLKERFRRRDLLGIFIAIIGAVTVVFASNTSDTKLDPDTLLRAISQKAFIIYSCIYIGGAIILAGLSQGEVGRQWVFVDVGLCALFGGFTVLSTKAISTLLTMEYMDMFSQWITYPVLAVLILTGIGQVRYLNRALMRFDSKVVIPVQFVLFTLSAIIGSAILYGDFKKAQFHQVVTFLYGCGATFLGVFIIAWAPGIEEESDEEEADSADSRSQLTLRDRRMHGSLGRRRRATLIIPNRRRESSVPRSPALSLIGLSPAQHLLLVHTPPLEAPIHNLSSDVADRRRTMSWLDDTQHEGIRSASHDGLGRRFKDTSSLRIGSLNHSSSHR